jgi:hypothetical protein
VAAKAPKPVRSLLLSDAPDGEADPRAGTPVD